MTAGGARETDQGFRRRLCGHDQVRFTGSPEEALDLVCDIYVTNA